MLPESEPLIDGKSIARRAREIIAEKHGEDTAVFDVRGVSGITDYTVVTSGGSPPHLKALVNELQRALKEDGVPPYRRSGTPESGWLVLDYVDAVIHIFDRSARAYYAIEALWAEAPRLD